MNGKESVTLLYVLANLKVPQARRCQTVRWSIAFKDHLKRDSDNTPTEQILRTAQCHKLLHKFLENYAKD